MRSIIALLLLLPTSLLAVTVTIYPTPAHCGLSNGRAIANASGGLPPYSYSWSNGETTQSISGLVPGDYTVTVTDGLSNTAQATATVTALFELAQPTGIMMIQPDCMGQCSGIVSFSESEFMGTTPYIYSGPISAFNGTATGMGLCAGSSGFTVTDANGCPGIVELGVMPVEPATVTILNTTPACAGETNGTLTVQLEGVMASSLQVVHTNSIYDQTFYPSSSLPYTITGLPAGDYVLISAIPGWQGGALCGVNYNTTIPELPAPCGAVSGSVFNDADGDCMFDANEYGLPYRVLTITPGPSYAITDDMGAYYAGSAFGSFNLAQPLVEEAPLCPASSTVPYTISALTPDVNVDLADSSFAPLDTRAHLWASSARPGFPVWVCASVWNSSAYPSGGMSVTLNYDPMLDPVTFSTPPTTTSSGFAEWDLAPFLPFGNFHFWMNGAVPADINLLGSAINYSISATDAEPELNTANNSASLDVTINGSYDPNDKIGITSSGFSASQYFLDQDEWIDYTVRFQNTGTVAAEIVVIRDTLDVDLDIASLEILGASHEFTPSFGQGRELIFTFNNINLPDSTTDFNGSQGFVSYRVKPKTGIVVSDVLENTAGIYFDFNPPITTNTTSLVVDFSTSLRESGPDAMRLAPNPTSDVLNVILPIQTAGYEVLGIDGRHVQVPGTRRENGFELDVHSLQAGTYLIRTGNCVARFVKQ